MSSSDKLDPRLKEAGIQHSPKLEMIDWQDHSSENGWFTAFQLAEDDFVLKMRTVGYVVQETDQFVRVTHTVHGSTAMDPLTILKADIVGRWIIDINE